MYCTKAHDIRLPASAENPAARTCAASDGFRLKHRVKFLGLDLFLFHERSRTAVQHIRMGGASLNYVPCERTDAPVKEGDILSLRGYGKGRLKAVGGRSKKDRLFVEAEVYL